MISEPTNLTDEQKKKIIKAELYKRNGGKISCGHNFHDKMKEVDFGDTVLCTACFQYFVKMKNLVWWIDGKENRPPRSAHLDGVWYHRVDMRLQDGHGNTL